MLYTVCHLHVTRMFWYVIRMSLVCTRMSPLWNSYVLVCHAFVTRLWFYHEPCIMLPSKLENLSRCCTKLIHVCKHYHLHWIAVRANILSKYIMSIFSSFGRGFCGSFPTLPEKLQPLVKKFELIFAALYFYIYELKKCVSDF